MSPVSSSDNHRMSLQRVTADDWEAFRDVRLRALREDPDAFGSSYAREAPQDPAWWREWASKSETGQTHVLYLASDADKWIGMAGGVVEDGIAWLISMWVAPEARRRGIGRELTEAVVEWARGIGRRRIGLLVETNNDAAASLYRATGFEPTGETRPQRSNPALKVARYERSLDDG